MRIKRGCRRTGTRKDFQLSIWPTTSSSLWVLHRFGVRSERRKVLTRAWWRTLTVPPNIVSSALCPTRPNLQSTSSVRWGLPWTQGIAARCGETDTRDHRLACTDQPGQKKLNRPFGFFLKHCFLFMSSNFYKEKVSKLSSSTNSTLFFLHHYTVPCGLVLFICLLNLEDIIDEGPIRGAVRRLRVCFCASHPVYNKFNFLPSGMEDMSVNATRSTLLWPHRTFCNLIMTSQDVLNYICDPEMKNCDHIEMVLNGTDSHRLFIRPVYMVSYFDLDKVEMKRSF